MVKIDKPYLEKIKERRKKSRVYTSYQSTGLYLANILGDKKHKSLYIKLAKENNQEKLVNLAKRVVERKNISNKGAYFMRIFEKESKKKNKNKPSYTPIHKKISV